MHIGPVTLICMLLAGCVAAPVDKGRAFNIGYADQMVIGRTTRADVLANLGEPPKKFVEGDEDVWQYEHLSGYAGTAIITDFAQLNQQVLKIGFRGNFVSDCAMRIASGGASGFAGLQKQETSEARWCGIGNPHQARR